MSATKTLQEETLPDLLLPLTFESFFRYTPSRKATHERKDGTCP